MSASMLFCLFAIAVVPVAETPSGKPQIQAPPAAQVALVLDCSESMKLAERMKPAEAAVVDVLSILKDERFNVAVWLFGHRKGFEEDKVKWNNAVLDGKPIFPYDPKITHDNDVQKIERADFQTFFGHNLLRGMGKTPLRLALIQSLDWLAAGDRSIPRRLIVLTDGAATDSTLKNEDVAARMKQASGDAGQQRVKVTFLADSSARNALPYLHQLVQSMAEAVGERLDEQSVRLIQVPMQLERLRPELHKVLGVRE